MTTVLAISYVPSGDNRDVVTGHVCHLSGRNSGA